MEVELGVVKGCIPVKLGFIGLLLLVTDKALVLMKISKELIKPYAVDRFMEARTLVSLAKLNPKELSKKIMEEHGKYKVLSFIRKENVKMVEFYKKLFGLGTISMKIHTFKGDKIDLTLIYGIGTGWSDKEALNHSLKLLSNTGIRVEKKFK